MTISGWASVEEPRHQLSEAPDHHDYTCCGICDEKNYPNEAQRRNQGLLEDLESGIRGQAPDPLLPVHALLLWRIFNSPGGFAIGNIWWNSVPVFVVLLVQEVRKPGHETPFYERVGVGRLFGLEAEKVFDAAEEVDLWLV